jgi:hypothetical protein
LPFLLTEGQAGPGAFPGGAQLARRITAAQPDGRSGELCGVPKLTGPTSNCG